MVNVCAWCDRFLGIKDPLDVPSVTHGICKPCSTRQMWEAQPVVVVSPEREHLVPVLSELLRGVPEIHVLVERRRGTGEQPGQERRRTDAVQVI